MPLDRSSASSHLKHFTILLFIIIQFFLFERWVFQSMVTISKQYATVITEINIWRGNWTFVPQYEFVNWTTKVYAIKRGIIYFSSSLTQPSLSCQSKIQVGIFCLSCQSSSQLVCEWLTLFLILIFVACVCSFVILLTFYNNPFCLAMGDKDMNICHVLLLCHCFSFINEWYRDVIKFCI